MTIATWDEKNKNAVLLTCVGCGKPFYFSVPRPEPRCAFCKGLIYMTPLQNRNDGD